MCSLRVSSAVFVLVPALVVVFVSSSMGCLVSTCVVVSVVVPMVADGPAVVGVVVAVAVAVSVVRVVAVPSTVIPVAEAETPGVIPARIVGAEPDTHAKTARTIHDRDRDSRDEPRPGRT